MNILMIDQYAGSPRMGMELRPFELCYEWNRLGCRTRIVAGSWSHLRRMNPRQTAKPFCCQERGVEFLLLPTPPYRGNGIGRAENVFAFARGLWRVRRILAKEFSPDAVIVSSTHPFDYRAASAAARLAGAKTVFELHDIWPLSLCELHGYQPGHPLMRLIDGECRRAFSHCDLVASILPRGEQYLQNRKIPFQNYALFPNGVSCSGTSLPPAKIVSALTSHRSRYGSLVLYAGGSARANCMDDLVCLARECPEIGFAAIGGKGTPLPGAPENLIAVSSVEHGQLGVLLAMGDVLWLGTKPYEIYRYGVAMNKLFDYLASARPVIFSCACRENPVSLSGGGITVPAGDMIQTAGALRDLLRLSDDERNAMGRRGHDYVWKCHRYSVIAKDYLKRLEELCHASARFV